MYYMFVSAFVMVIRIFYFLGEEKRLRSRIEQNSIMHLSCYVYLINKLSGSTPNIS